MSARSRVCNSVAAPSRPPARGLSAGRKPFGYTDFQQFGQCEVKRENGCFGLEFMQKTGVPECESMRAPPAAPRARRYVTKFYAMAAIMDSRAFRIPSPFFIPSRTRTPRLAIFTA